MDVSETRALRDRDEAADSVRELPGERVDEPLPLALREPRVDALDVGTADLESVGDALERELRDTGADCGADCVAYSEPLVSDEESGDTEPLARALELEEADVVCASVLIALKDPQGDSDCCSEGEEFALGTALALTLPRATVVVAASEAVVDTVPENESTGVEKGEPLGEALTEGDGDEERVARGEREASAEKLELVEREAASVAGAVEVGVMLTLRAFEGVGDADADAQQLEEGDGALLKLARDESVACEVGCELSVAEAQPESSGLEEATLLAPALGVCLALEADDAEGDIVACAGVCVPERDALTEALFAAEEVAVIEPSVAD